MGDEWRQPRVILFTGSSPGAGKSTVSALLAQQLALGGRRTEWLDEEAMVALLDRLVPELAVEWPPLDVYLRAASALVAWCTATDATCVADSVLPWYTFLYGRYPREELESFSAELGETLRPLQPLVVYLRIEPVTALRRAVDQRGRRWIENIIGWVNSWRLPYAEGLPRPLRTLEDLAALFDRVDELALDLLPRWPAETLILDVALTPVDESLTAILAHLGARTQRAVASPTPDLWPYTGVYVPLDGGSGEVVHIIAVDGGLVVNTYWPGGTRLIAEGAHRFRLESTNRRIMFEITPDGTARGMTYVHGGRTDRYRRDE